MRSPSLFQKKEEKIIIFVVIICLLVLLILGQYVIKTAIDTSKNTQHMKEILEELKEIKSVLKERQ
jgi:uncharacterized membrane protein affecting hemolysin expression